MDWQEDGILLSVRRHGESAAIIEVFTETHGRHAGIVRGGAGKRMGPVLQPGAQLHLTWRARLEEHLGMFTVEPLTSRAGLMSDRLALAGLNATLALAAFALPERQAYPDFYRETQTLLGLLEGDASWLPHYVGWEITLLSTLGFGLDLSACAVTGTREGLTHVSPKSGRAVSEVAGREWVDRLLPLPPFLRVEQEEAPITATDLRDGLHLTGYFLRHWMCPALSRDSLPPARERLISAIDRA